MARNKSTWTVTEDALLLKLVEEGYSWQAVSREIGYSATTCNKRHVKLSARTAAREMNASPRLEAHVKYLRRYVIPVYKLNKTTYQVGREKMTGPNRIAEAKRIQANNRILQPSYDHKIDGED